MASIRLQPYFIACPSTLFFPSRLLVLLPCSGDLGQCLAHLRHAFDLHGAVFQFEIVRRCLKHFGGGLTGAADKIVGGWQIAGITTLSTGNWYTITDGNGNFANSDGGQRADLVAGQDLMEDKLPLWEEQGDREAWALHREDKAEVAAVEEREVGEEVEEV